MIGCFWTQQATDESYRETAERHAKDEKIRALADALTQPTIPNLTSKQPSAKSVSTHPPQIGAGNRRKWNLENLKAFKSTPDLARIEEEDRVLPTPEKPRLVRDVTKVLEESEIKFQRRHIQRRSFQEHLGGNINLNRIRAFIEVN